MIRMSKLRDIFYNLNNPTYCSYSTDRPYTTILEEEIVNLPSLEVLEVSRDFPREQILIGYFKDDFTRISYAGDDVNSMKITIKELRLSKSPLNLGEVIFHNFGIHLDDIKSCPVHLEQLIEQGNEHKLQFVLEKVICVYSGRKIDEEFYTIHAARK